MNVYWIIVGLVILLGMIMPQQGYRRKWYIIMMMILHSFVCGFRYMYLTGDLRKYATTYSALSGKGWFSEEVFQEGRNAGFSWIMKLISTISHDDFQILLIVLAIVGECIMAVMIYKYSPSPWLSYLVWNCMGFYVAGFSLIKQYLAMAVIMCAVMCIFQKNVKGFLVFTLLAGFIHTPALAFLPAYWLANRKLCFGSFLGYTVAAGVIFAFRTPIVNWMADLYYEEETFQLADTSLGGRFIVIVIILLCGFLLKGFREKQFEQLFNLIIIAAILQMFSGFNNVFTRLADYYLQFTVLFIPMIFYESKQSVQINHYESRPLLLFNERSIKILILCLCIILIWWYYKTCIGVTTLAAVDDYTNFRFMWDVLE